jgi:hypothetical protein
MKFADRLNMALKALSIGRTRIAADLGVDKSMVSRWLGGTARPSTQNLERLTRLIASHSPGFSLLDWESLPAQFVQRFGMADAISAMVVPGPSRQSHPGALPFGLLDRAAAETERRSAAYIGRWRITRLRAALSVFQPVVEYALIRPDGAGLRFEHMFRDNRLRGWMILLQGIAYASAADNKDDSLASYCFNGAVGPKVSVMDGIMTSVTGVHINFPFAQAIVMERVGELEGDVADDAWADAAQGWWGHVTPESLQPEVLAVIGRDFGARAAAAGGDAILRLPTETSLARGSYAPALRDVEVDAGAGRR